MNRIFTYLWGGNKIDLKHRRNEKTKTIEYTVTVSDSELKHYKEMMSGPLDQDLIHTSQILTDIVSEMIARKIMSDLRK